ncbi:telomeric repeat-binding factor 2 [Capsicum galapagoense]
MGIDTHISQWILEFILRQPLDDNILNDLINVLPLPNDNLNLKRALLVRKIESEIANGSVTEKILELMELIEELDHQEGIIRDSVATKAAYCAVAVECTVKFLKSERAGSDKGKYFEAVRRIWKRRINLIEKVENVGVLSEELWSWRDEIEAALWEDRCAENVIRRSKGVFAVDVVNAFVREAKERIGAPFLEVVAETYHTDEAVKSVFGEVNKGGASKKNGKEVCKGNALPRKKHVAFKRTRGASGIRISDSIESEVEASGGQDDSSAEVKIAKKALKLSSLELRAMVKDPLPDALRFAETLSSVVRDNMGHQPAENNSDMAPQPMVSSSRMAQAGGENREAQQNCHHAAASKPDLANRSSAAHTFEWDSFLDDINEGSPSGVNRVTLPSPKRTKVSPLKKYEFKKITTRRKPVKWSALEEDTLRTGVQKYGIGNWKVILDAYRDIFTTRQSGDLKDKWRNMIS